MISIGFTKDDLKRVAWTFVQAFLAVFVAGLADAFGAFSQDGLSAGKAALVALGVGAVAAGISAVKNLVLADASTLK